MKNATRKSWCLIEGALLFALLAVGPLAAQTTTLNLTGAGPGEIVWGTSEGIYTSPYSGNVGGPTIPVICDDFVDNTYLPESWTAYVTQLSTLSSSTDPTLKWTTGDFGTLTQDAAYTVASVLAVEILNPSNTALAQEELSFAMWALFDPNGVGVSDPSDQGALGWLATNGYSNTPGSFYASVLTDLSTAVAYASNSANKNQVQADVNATTIYSYDPANGVWGCNGCSGPPQEFISVKMAEPASPALLGFDLLCVAGLLFFVRRRFTGSMHLN
jgi:hypothetical protein